MTNRDMLLDFSRVVEVFKAENDFCVVPTLLPLNAVLSVGLLEWLEDVSAFDGGVNVASWNKGGRHALLR